MTDAGLRISNNGWEAMSNVAVILRMIKFEHTLFALPLAFAGVLLAGGWPSWTTVVLVLTAMFGARSAAMAFNRLVDAEFDRRNPRTAMREIPTGMVKKIHAVLFVCASAALFFVSAWLLNPLCFLFSPVALTVVLFYSYTKRFTPLCHLFLGLALSLAPLGGWIAVTGSLSWQPLILALGVLLWVAGFDVLYSLMDIDFDREVGLKSMPAFLGVEQSFRLARLFHVAAWLLFLAAGVSMGVGAAYYASIVVIGLLLTIEHRLVNPGDLTHINTAFFTVNSFVSVVYFFGVLLDKIF